MNSSPKEERETDGGIATRSTSRDVTTVLVLSHKILGLTYSTTLLSLTSHNVFGGTEHEKQHHLHNRSTSTVRYVRTVSPSNNL